MKRKHNVVLILADDMGYGDCGCYGSDSIPTPRLDSLAEGGVRFTDFHSNGVVCSPTRAALLTGRYQQRCGIEGIVSAKRNRDLGMPVDEMTFADILKANGYRTGLFGKWHLGYEVRFNPVERGFDEFNGFLSGNVDYQSHIDSAGIEDWWIGANRIPEEGYSTDLVTEHGVQFIRENRNRPFCLYLAHECPHFPYQGPNDPAYRTPGHPQPSHGPRKDQDQAYKEMMMCMDSGVGRIVDTLRELGLEEDTFVFFFSDNGPEGPGSSGPLHGRKGSVWEGGHRVPAIAYWPTHIPRGIVCDLQSMSMDLFSTVMSVTDTSLPKNISLDGIDLIPFLRGDPAFPERSLFWRYHGQKAVRWRQWKLVVNVEGGPDLALFDLKDDLPESRNLASREEDIVKDLQARLSLWERDVARGSMLT